jgi:hypothetical protein
MDLRAGQDFLEKRKSLATAGIWTPVHSLVTVLAMLPRPVEIFDSVA